MFLRSREDAVTPLAGFDTILRENLYEPDAIAHLVAQYRAIHAYVRDRIDPATALAVLMRTALGVDWEEPWDELNRLLSELDSAEPEEAHKTVTQELYLTVGQFRQLMEMLGGSVTPEEWEEIYAILAQVALVGGVLQLIPAWEQGNPITSRLEQLSLTVDSLSCLTRIRNLLAKDQTVLDSEWDEVYNILVQVRKRRKFADWRQQEQESDLSLSPDHFQIPVPLPLQFPPLEPEPLPPWRATWRDRRDWQDTLETRIEQQQTVIAALSEAVSKTEEETLPQLRDALILATDVAGSNLPSKAKFITDQFLIDAKSGGCRLTTRISQTIKTIQGLLWSLRTGQLQDTYPDLKLEADHFDEEWQWLGEYANWRTATFVFLYPENILLPSLRREQTPAFSKLVDDLRGNRRLTAKDACLAAKEYADYFEDVCTLEVQATCYGETRIHKGDRCGERATPEKQDLFYLFAIGGKTKAVYWSACVPDDKVGYTQTFWKAVPGLEKVQVTKIVGSVPYKKTNEQRFIFLFLLAEEGGETKLLFTKCDLERGGHEGWDDEPEELQLPELYWWYYSVNFEMMG